MHARAQNLSRRDLAPVSCRGVRILQYWGELRLGLVVGQLLYGAISLRTKEHFSMDTVQRKITKQKPPRWFRILRYNFNCLWYHVLMPVGMPEDEFSKMIRESRERRKK